LSRVRSGEIPLNIAADVTADHADDV